jgi:hypothetical protein
MKGLLDNAIKNKISNMKLKLFMIFVVMSIFACSEASKVIFARNTTAQAIRQLKVDKTEQEKDELTTRTGTILNIPGNCKPGFVYESTFHNRCRRIAR